VGHARIMAYCGGFGYLSLTALTCE
jgi:hypothetical protein